MSPTSYQTALSRVAFTTITKASGNWQPLKQTFFSQLALKSLNPLQHNQFTLYIESLKLIDHGEAFGEGIGLIRLNPAQLAQQM